MQTTAQVAGGAIGAIVIDDADDELVNRPAEWANMKEHILVLQNLAPGFSSPILQVSSSDNVVPTSFYLANGQYQPVLPLGEAHTWYRLRMVHAAVTPTQNTFTVSEACQVRLMARDGVLVEPVGREIGAGVLMFAELATRADVAITCPAGEHPIKLGTTVIATLSVTPSNNETQQPPPLSTWSACRPTYLQDLRSSTPEETFSVQISNRAINGQPYNPDTILHTFTANKIQEWTISMTQMHPYHQHISQFQLMSAAPSAGVAPKGWFESGDWWDTYYSPGGGMMSSATIRFKTPYESIMILHCHILQHEDMGAMAVTQSIGGGGVGVGDIVVDDSFVCPASDALPIGTVVVDSTTSTGTNGGMRGGGGGMGRKSGIFPSTTPSLINSTSSTTTGTGTGINSGNSTSAGGTSTAGDGSSKQSGGTDGGMVVTSGGGMHNGQRQWLFLSLYIIIVYFAL